MKGFEATHSEHSTLFTLVRVNRWTLRFAGALEPEFAVQFAAKALNQMRLCLLVSILFYSGFAALDALVAPQQLASLWWIRFAGFVPLSLLLFATTFTQTFRSHGQLLMGVWYLLAGLGIVAMIAQVPTAVANTYFVGLILVFIVGYTWARLRFVWATLVGWTLVVAYEAVVVGVLDTPTRTLVSNNFFLVSANLLGMLACYSAEEFARREFLALRRVAEEKARARVANEALAEANQTLDRLARVDQLTGIANRREFDQALSHEWARMRRERKELALILIDIDHFKLFNDTYGHPAGDACLSEVARALAKRARRPADLAARYGGEEFVVLLPDTGVDGARHVAHAIREAVVALAIPHEKNSAAAVVTISLGVAVVVPTPTWSADWLVKQADAALYRAKELGRNGVVLASPPGVSATPAEGAVS